VFYDDTRFKQSSSDAPYCGQAPTRFDLVEIGQNSRVSKRWDALARDFEYRAANAILQSIHGIDGLPIRTNTIDELTAKRRQRSA
jgi:hypothetical protein